MKLGTIYWACILTSSISSSSNDTSPSFKRYQASRFCVLDSLTARADDRQVLLLRTLEYHHQSESASVKMQETYTIREGERGRGRGQTRGRGRGYFVSPSLGSIHPSSGVFRALGSGGYNSFSGGCYDGFEADSGYRWFDDGDSPQSCPESSQILSRCTEERAYPFQGERSFRRNLHEEHDVYCEFGENVVRNGPGHDTRKAYARSSFATAEEHATDGQKDRLNSTCSPESNSNGAMNGSGQENGSKKKGSVPGNWRYQDPERRGIASSLDCCHAPGRVFERGQKDVEYSFDDHGGNAKQGSNLQKGIMQQTTTRTGLIKDSNSSNQWVDTDNGTEAKSGEKNSLNCDTTKEKDNPLYESGNFKTTKGRTLRDFVNPANSLSASGKTDLQKASGGDGSTVRNCVGQTGREDHNHNLVHDSAHNPDPSVGSPNGEQKIKKDTDDNVHPREEFTTRESHNSDNNVKTEVELDLCHGQVSRDAPRAACLRASSKARQWTHGLRTSVTETQDEMLHSNPQAVSSIVSEIVAQMNLTQTTPIADQRSSADSCPRRDVAPTVEYEKDYQDGTDDVTVGPSIADNGSGVDPCVLCIQDNLSNGFDTECHPNSCSNKKDVKGERNGGPRELARCNKNNTTIENPHTQYVDGRLQGLCSTVLRGIVQINVTQCIPNYSVPWQMCRQTQSTFSGFIIHGRRIITNAHTVHNCTVVRVKKNAEDRKYIARVLATGKECDLALLTVAEDEFWQDTMPLQFGQMPEAQTRIFVVGYSPDCRGISVSTAAVLHVGIQDYAQGASQLLGIQIDTAIASGKAGAPALNRRSEVVGVASRSLYTCDSGNVGHLVAEEVVDHFLRDYQNHGNYTGFCHCGFHWQKMENISLRKSMKMADTESGIMVRRVHKTSLAFQVLREGDVVTAIEGISISNAGTVPYIFGERISFHHVISNKFVGDSVRFQVLRQGKSMQITYKLGEVGENLLVPVHERQRRPEYYIIAGLVFIALSEPYLIAEYGDKWDLRAPVRLVERLMYGSKERKDEQIVILSRALSAEINVGYECVRNAQVHRFNDERIRNLAHLAQLVDKCSADYLRFELDEEIVIISREESIEVSPEILDTHCVPKACYFER